MKTMIFCELTMDGKLTTGQNVTSKKMLSILNHQERNYIQKIRSKYDAIMVGKNTVVIDNPFLTNRYKKSKKLTRVIPTTSLNISLASNIFIDDNPTIIVTTKEQSQNAAIQKIQGLGKECICLGKNKVDFASLFTYLESRGIKSIIIEGGGELNCQLLEQNLVDCIEILFLPIIVGGDKIPSFAGNQRVLENYAYKIAKIKKFENMVSIKYEKDTKNGK